VLGYSNDSDTFQHKHESKYFKFPIQNVDYVLFTEKQKEISQRAVDYIHTFSTKTIVENYYSKFSRMTIVFPPPESEPDKSLLSEINKLLFTSTEKEEIIGFGISFDFIAWENHVKALKDTFIEIYDILKKKIDEFKSII
jgi:hypothetical protein